MKTLREYIKEAEEKKVAIGHFNFSNLEGFHAIVWAAKELGLPIILGVSEGERDFVGIHESVALVKSAREQGIPVFLNADHTYSLERAKEAIDAGFDAIIFDGVKLPLEENIEITKQVVEYAREVGEREGREILVESELGFIGESSKLLEEIPAGAGESKTDPEEALRFVQETGIDLLAPSIGNIHGMVKGGNPELDIELIKNIHETAGVPLVLHGGSGISDENFVQGISAGIGIVHINTEIRKAFRDGLEKSLRDNDSVAPYKYLAMPREEIKKVVMERLKLFNS